MAKTKEKHGVVSVVSIIISGLAFLVSVYAAWNAHLARIDSRKIAGLDLSPVLVLSEHFQKSPPDFTIYNNGPVEAIYLDVEQVLHFYEKGEIGASQGQGENKYRISRMVPQEKISIILDETLLDNATKVKPIGHSVLEIRLVYRRPSDRKLFRKSAFFFINPQGKWVSEYDNSLTPSVYEPIKMALLKSAYSWTKIPYPFGVPLHSIEPTE